jgi:hypothetical protein
MKKIACCTLLFIGVAFAKNASAQFKSNQEQPKWAPAGNDQAEYYFLPDIDTYYYVPKKQFIYQSGGHWTFSSKLPAAHQGYDLRAGNKVVCEEAGAYRYYTQHKAKYGAAQTNAGAVKDQPVIKSKQAPTSGKTSG